MKPIKTEDFLRMYKSDPGRIRAPRRYAKIKICGPDRPGRPVQAALKKVVPCPQLSNGQLEVGLT